MQVPPRTAFGVLGSLLVVGVSVLLYAGSAPRKAPNPPGSRPPLLGLGMAAFPRGHYPKGPLPVGSAAPALTAQGWLNGRPPGKYGDLGRLVLIDIWAPW
jgi:hypothetical protein